MIAIQCSLVHKNVPIGIHNIPLFKNFFSNVAVNKLNAGVSLEFHTFKLFLMIIMRGQGFKAKTPLY